MSPYHLDECKLGTRRGECLINHGRGERRWYPEFSEPLPEGPITGAHRDASYSALFLHCSAVDSTFTCICSSISYPGWFLLQVTPPFTHGGCFKLQFQASGHGYTRDVRFAGFSPRTLCYIWDGAKALREIKSRPIVSVSIQDNPWSDTFTQSGPSYEPKGGMWSRAWCILGNRKRNKPGAVATWVSSG